MYVTPEYITLDTDFFRNIHENVGKCKNILELHPKIMITLSIKVSVLVFRTCPCKKGTVPLLERCLYLGGVYISEVSVLKRCLLRSPCY